MDEKVTRVILQDLHIKGAFLLIVGTCISLSPYIALGFNMPVPESTADWICFTGYIVSSFGIGVLVGYVIVDMFLAIKQISQTKEVSTDSTRSSN
jgi:hypothetical protein